MRRRHSWQTARQWSTDLAGSHAKISCRISPGTRSRLSLSHLARLLVDGMAGRPPPTSADEIRSSDGGPRRAARRPFLARTLVLGMASRPSPTSADETRSSGDGPRRAAGRPFLARPLVLAMAGRPSSTRYDVVAEETGSRGGGTRRAARRSFLALLLVIGGMVAPHQQWTRRKQDPDVVYCGGG